MNNHPKSAHLIYKLNTLYLASTDLHLTMISERRRKIIQGTILLISVGFVLLTLVVTFLPVNILDTSFSKEVQEHQNPLLDITMEFISWFGYFPGSAIVVIVAAAAFFYFKYKKEALFVLITSVSGLISTIIKAIVERPRPTDQLVRVVRKVGEESFPSGHVLFYVVFFGFLLMLMYQLKSIPRFIRLTVSVISGGLILTIPISRVYLGAHWFTDVVGGFLLGLICLYVLSYFYEKYSTARRVPNK